MRPVGKSRVRFYFQNISVIIEITMAVMLITLMLMICR